MHYEHVARIDERTERAAARGAWRNDDLRDSERKGVHGVSAEQNAFRPSQAKGSLQTAFGMQPQADSPHSLAHHLHGAPSAAGVTNVIQATAACGSHLLTAHIGDGE